MTDKLPPNLLKLFAPRPPLNYLPPLDKDPEKRVGAIVTGLAQHVVELRDYDSSYVPWKTAEEKKREKMEQRQKKAEEHIKEGLANYDPNKDEQIEGDPFHTLFVYNLSYKLTEEDLLQEFDVYGPIKKLRIVKTKDGKPRGYAFIEFEREKHMKAAYKDADGMKLFGRRIQVDVERGRTVKNWKPRRLGGGLGSTRSEKKEDVPSSNYSSGGGGGGGGGGRKDYDDYKRSSSRRSRSRSPRGHRDRYSSSRGKDRSRERSSRRDRYV